MSRIDEPAAAEIASWVLGVLWNPTGEFIRPGNFYELLIRAGAAADQVNASRLAMEFPEVMMCIALYKEVEGGTEFLREYARKWEYVNAKETGKETPGDGT